MESEEGMQAGNEHAATLDNLPYELTLRVCGFLEPRDLLCLSMVCSQTHTVASDHSLWRELCMSSWRKPNLSPAIRTKIDLSSSTREINWKGFYYQKQSLERRWIEEKYVIHKIPHQGTTVIQVLRTNKRLYEGESVAAEDAENTHRVPQLITDDDDDDEEDDDMSQEEVSSATSGDGEDDEESDDDEPAKQRPKKGRRVTSSSGSAETAAAFMELEAQAKETLGQPLVDEEDEPKHKSGDDDDKNNTKRKVEEKKKKEKKKEKPKEKKKKNGQKTGGRPQGDEADELVDWGWDFVTGDDDGQVILWSGQEFKEKKVVKAHDFIWWLEVHSDTCITASTDWTAKVIDLNKMEVVRTLEGHPTALWCVDFSLEEDYVVSGGQNGDFVAWRLSDGKQLAHHHFGSGLFDVRCVVTDLPIERRHIRVNNAREEEEERDEQLKREQEEAEEEAAKAAKAGEDEDDKEDAAARRRRLNRQRLAICTAVGDIDFYLYDVDTRQVIGAFTGHLATVTTVKRDGDLVLSGSDDKTIRVWNLTTLKCLYTFSVGGIVYDIRLCENKLVAGVTGERSSFLRVWDYTKKTHMMDIPVAQVPRRIFSITVLPDRIYCCTNERITVVDFRDVEGVEVKCKPKKSNRAARARRENCLLQ